MRGPIKFLALISATGIAATSLMACSSMAGGESGGAAATGQAQLSTVERAAITAAIASPTRTAANRARDAHRHPYETLSFFGLRPGQTVVEIWPGAGWYTEILAPHARATTGTYYAAGPWDRGLNGVRGMMSRDATVYGGIRLAEFPSVAGSNNAQVPAGSADLVLTFRNVHNWRFGGTDSAQQAFNQMFAMLRPGGRLGVVEHRLPETMPSALEESSGYMKVSSVIAFAQAAGFRLVGQSEINANPRDTHEHPGGVWWLPPVMRGVTDDADRAARNAIGESDRMTLLFVRPE